MDTILDMAHLGPCHVRGRGVFLKGIFKGDGDESFYAPRFVDKADRVESSSYCLNYDFMMINLPPGEIFHPLLQIRLYSRF